jgi:hypothetical protein
MLKPQLFLFFHNGIKTHNEIIAKNERKSERNLTNHFCVRLTISVIIFL